MEKQIREMCPSDWPEVSEIYLAGIKTGQATFQDACPSYEEWDSSHLSCCRLVLLADEKIAGWAALTPVSSRCFFNGVAELSIYIRTDYQRMGLGEALLNSLASASELAGFWTLQSGIMQDNEPSIKLHEKCGFRMVGYRERIARDPFGVWRNIVLMERRRADDPVEGCDCLCRLK
jgi:phosphinothricin acetyltransferase